MLRLKANKTSLYKLVAEFMLLTAQNLEYILHMAISDNEAILEFLLRRDAPGAREAMSIHMRHMLNALST